MTKITKEVNQEIREERGKEVEWDNSENCFLREEKALLNRIDEHIVNQNEEV